MGPGDSNIYYIRNSWPGGYTNIWMYSSDQGETQVTDFAWPMEVRDFFLVADTLLVVLCDFSGPSFFKETRVTIPLK